MFHKIALAYNESPESQRALVSAIQLAKSLKAELLTVTVMTSLPAYTAYVAAVDTSLSHVLMDDRLKFYRHCRRKQAHLLTNTTSNSLPTLSKEAKLTLSLTLFANRKQISW
jgi:Universal stress protein family